MGDGERRVNVRIKQAEEETLALAAERWPGENSSDLIRRILGEWRALQSLGQEVERAERILQELRSLTEETRAATQRLKLRDDL